MHETLNSEILNLFLTRGYFRIYKSSSEEKEIYMKIKS